ncbi:MAG TPA: LssY C-terminal domain-containing protein, partial [Ktedonobacterales bacterium]|nr:LssY C-terminal domain-containing protein [Ktedonobacterales bacterium]
MGAFVFSALPFPVELPSQIDGFATPVIIAIDIGLALILVLLVMLVVRVIRAGRYLRKANREGRQISRRAMEALPLTSFRRDGVPGDPLNVRMLATESQLGAAFANAGWYRADEITLITSLR